MNIIEVKNNFVKLCYEGELVLSGFILITDNNKSYIAQILHLEAARVGKIAIARILFNYNNGISAYDGSIPSLRAEIKPVETSILLDILDKKDPLILGKLTPQQYNITVNFDILKDNPIILAEKLFETKILLNNLALQIQTRKHKIVVFDTLGMFKANKLTVTKDFKLPLNNSTINYIYEEEFKDATAESKSIIQTIFAELGEYSKTVEFIPFDTFRAVVNSEFMRTKLIQLIILKNKIKQLQERNIFAQKEADFGILKKKLENENTTVIDMSCLNESLQKECIKYVYTVLKNIGMEFFSFIPLSDENSDRFIINELYNTENVHSIVICGYDYKNLPVLKKCSKNMIMFTPLKQQKDFGGYNIFLQKLAEDEFIVYGKMTKFVPLIAKLYQYNTAEVFVPMVNETLQKISDQKQESIPAQKIDTEVVQELNISDKISIKEDLSSDIEAENNQAEEAEIPPKEVPAAGQVDIAEIENKQAEEVEIPPTEVPAAEQANIVEAVNNQAEEAEIPPTEVPAAEQADIVEAENNQAEEAEIPPTEVPVAEQADIAEIENNQAEEAEIPPKEVPTAEQDDIVKIENKQAEAEIPPKEVPTAGQVDIVDKEAEKALDEIPDIEDDEELSDDDLDMIEELSKPDDEIPIINQPEKVKEPDNTVRQNAAVKKQEEKKQEGQKQALPRQVKVPAKPAHKIPEKPANNKIPAPKRAEKPAEPLQKRSASTPVVPVYSSDIPDEDKVNSDKLKPGDKVIHQEFGEGVVEKMINYGNKLLCSVNFAGAGRRLLNPEISEMKRI